MEALAIEARRLIKNYGRVEALRGLDLEVRRGEIFGFLGPNGAGKTTTIRCLLDLIRPNGGTLRVLGIDPQRDSVLVRSSCGYLPGELYFDGNLTPESALRYLNALRGGEADWGYVQSLSERLDLDMKRPIRNLSRGNKLKVGVVQALMHRPQLLLLDEPTTGLDPLIQLEVLRLIREAQADGATVFFSSHNIKEIEAIANRVAIIRQGVVVEVVKIDQLFERALRRAKIRFREKVDPQPLLDLKEVTLLDRNDDSSILVQITGDMDAFLKRLAGFPVIDMETSRPTLDEIFLAYYDSREA